MRLNADTRKARKHRRTAIDSNPHHDLDKGQTSGLLIGCPWVLPWSTRRAPRTRQYKVKRQTGRTYHKVPVPVPHFPNITVRNLCHFLDGDNEMYEPDRPITDSLAPWRQLKEMNQTYRSGSWTCAMTTGGERFSATMISIS